MISYVRRFGAGAAVSKVGVIRRVDYQKTLVIALLPKKTQLLTLINQTLGWRLIWQVRKDSTVRQARPFIPLMDLTLVNSKEMRHLRSSSAEPRRSRRSDCSLSASREEACESLARGVDLHQFRSHAWSRSLGKMLFLKLLGSSAIGHTRFNDRPHRSPEVTCVLGDLPHEDIASSQRQSSIAEALRP